MPRTETAIETSVYCAGAARGPECAPAPTTVANTPTPTDTGQIADSM